MLTRILVPAAALLLAACSGPAPAPSEPAGKSVIEVTGANDRSKKEQSFYVLRNSIAPAVLVECGFVSNQQEAEHIVTSGYRKRLARGIANGITTFLNEVQGDPMYGVTITPDLPAAPEGLVQVPNAFESLSNIQ